MGIEMKLPPTGTLALIDKGILERRGKEKPRKYLGASLIGDECNRKIWYEYKRPKPITDPRLLRIFEMGDMVEDYVVKLLEDAGLEVYSKDENGEQFGFKFLCEKFAGHVDGVVKGLPESGAPHLLEIKSAKNSSFNQFVKNGVKKTSARYYGQVQVCMGALDLDDALFIVMNKDTQELYMERIKKCGETVFDLLCKAEEIIEADLVPARAYNNKDFFKCKWCNYRDECWE